METISDAARTHLSDTLKDRYPEIVWRAVYGFRNVAAQDCAGLTWSVFGRLWSIISTR